MSNQNENKNEGVFVKAKDKYSDLKSSATCLIIVGIIGLIVMILDCMDMFPISLNANKSFIFYFTMIGLFVLFLIIGFITLNSAKKIKSQISDEESQTDTIITWAVENLSAEAIDRFCTDLSNGTLKLENIDDSENNDDMEEETEFVEFDELPDELKYLQRCDVIGNIIKKNFKIEDTSYISTIVEEIYPEIFD
ncbi:MAG: hypothetical protein IJP13_05235 [Lachnospiraceae bacterium]|nr:hypothetical protein [Lachnospiraceae bacterium]